MSNETDIIGLGAVAVLGYLLIRKAESAVSGVESSLGIGSSAGSTGTAVGASIVPNVAGAIQAAAGGNMQAITAAGAGTQGIISAAGSSISGNIKATGVAASDIISGTGTAIGNIEKGTISGVKSVIDPIKNTGVTISTALSGIKAPSVTGMKIPEVPGLTVPISSTSSPIKNMISQGQSLKSTVKNVIKNIPGTNVISSSNKAVSVLSSDVNKVENQVSKIPSALSKGASNIGNMLKNLKAPW